MPIITIPKKFISKEDLVIIPRKEYEGLLDRAVPLSSLTSQEKKELMKIRKDMARGNYITLDELEHELGGPYSHKSNKRTK